MPAMQKRNESAQIVLRTLGSYFDFFFENGRLRTFRLITTMYMKLQEQSLK